MLRRNRALHGLRNAKRWTVPAISETAIFISDEKSVDSTNAFWREDIAIAHNNDVTALNHCCDVIADELSGLNKRLEALYESISCRGTVLFVGGAKFADFDTCETATAATHALQDVIREAIDGIPARV